MRRRGSSSTFRIMNNSPLRSRLVAVLGPTNTGKTHLAVERMLAHSSGMIGLPLRLLAREIYDRIVKARGAKSVALITGEEKIVPAHPHYFVCTVEAMPLDRKVEFVAIDEIQLCADPERGHVFTHRLLHARGPLRDDADGRGDHGPAGPPPLPERRDPVPRAPFDAVLRRTEEAHAIAPAQRRRRLLGRRGLRHRGADPPSSRRGGGGDGVAVAAHAQRPGRSSSSPARSNSWWRPTRSAWASTWTSTMSPSRACANSTAGGPGAFMPRRSGRSPAAPAVSAATARSA